MRVNRKARSRLARRGAAASFSGMSITAIVENDTIKLPVHVPDGTRVEITLPGETPSEKPKGALAWMSKFVGSIDTLPPDAAERHTELAHGKKRQIS